MVAGKGVVGWGVAALAGAAAAIHLILAVLSADPGIHSGGDNAAYLSLANALAQGDGYAESWYPGAPPHTKYPPLYPGLLALLILAGVRSWAAFKLLSAALTALAVAFCFLWARQRTETAGAATVALLFGISPALLDSSQWILSEPLFAACTFGCLWLLGASGSSPPAPRPTPAAASIRRWAVRLRSLPLPLAIGLVLAIAAYFTRSAGLPLVVAAALWLALARRWRSLVVFGALFALVALPWQLRSGGDYVSEFRLIDPYAPDLGLAGPADFAARIAANLTGYAFQHIPQAVAGLDGLAAALLGAVLAAAALAGWVWALRSGPGPTEFFVLLYAGLILIWPEVWSGERFALPLLPPLLLYAGRGLLRAGDAVFRACNTGLHAGNAGLHAGKPAHAGNARSRARNAPVPSRGTPAKSRNSPPRATRTTLGRPAGVLVAAAALLVAAPALNRWKTRMEWASRCRPAVLAQGPLGCYGPNVIEMQAIALAARDLLPAGSAVFSRKPRLFHIFSGLPSVTYPFTTDPDRMTAQADSLGIGHLVFGNWDSTGQRYLAPAILAHSERFCAAARLAAPGGQPVTLLAILPSAPDDSTRTPSTPAEEGLLLPRCSGPAPPPPPSAAALASPHVPILGRP